MLNREPSSMMKHGSGTPREAGLTLVEVLVALVIISVGVLGVAGLQAVSKKANHQAFQRTMATHLVDEIIERIRANPSGAASYHTGTNTPIGGGSIAAEPSPDCETATCTPAQLAAHDRWAWEQALDGASITVAGTNAGGLVIPQGCIVFTAATGMTNTGKITVMLAWEGLTDISDAVAAGETACGTSAAAGSDASRRQVVVNTYVFDPAES